MFKKATKERAHLRIALTGPSGSGKSYTALQLAATLSDKIAAIDTERGSLSKYADIVEFDVMELDNFHPNKYIEAINMAVKGGYEVLIIDSISHEWDGEGGILSIVDQQAAISKSGNSYTAWRSATPIHNRFVGAILQAPIHVIVTMRSKTAYVMEDTKGGKKAPKKVGLETIQRDGVEYEFDIVGDMTIENIMEISKSRYAGIKGWIVEKPAKDCELFMQIASWLTTEPNTVQAEAVKSAEFEKADTSKAPSPDEKLNKQQAKELYDIAIENGIEGEQLGKILTEMGYDGRLLNVPYSDIPLVAERILNASSEVKND